MSFNFRHPSYYAKIKKENRLTNKENYDKEINNEKTRQEIDREKLDRKFSKLKGPDKKIN